MAIENQNIEKEKLDQLLDNLGKCYNSKAFNFDGHEKTEWLAMQLLAIASFSAYDCPNRYVHADIIGQMEDALKALKNIVLKVRDHVVTHDLFKKIINDWVENFDKLSVGLKNIKWRAVIERYNEHVMELTLAINDGNPMNLEEFIKQKTKENK